MSLMLEGAEDQVGIIGYQKLLEDIELLGRCHVRNLIMDKVSNGETFSCILWFCTDKLWC